MYVVTSVLLATGWWLFSGREGEPSVLSRLSDLTDVELHTSSGWLLAALFVVILGAGWRGVRTFVVESLRYRRSELRWFLAWPRACFTGRFGRHEGHFDPGQRVANVLIVGSLLVATASGLGLVLIEEGTRFVWLLRFHRWATYILTPVLIGHVFVGLGLLPGYRGVWRAMHGRAGIRVALARRLWPGWTEKTLGDEGREDRIVVPGED